MELDDEDEAALAKRYRETYGRDSYTPEQIERMLAAAPVIHWRERRAQEPGSDQ